MAFNSSKPKINAFALFMRDRRRQLETEGKAFTGGWKDVATCVDNDWKNLTESAREDYRQRAKEMNGDCDDEPGRASCSSNYSGNSQADLRRTSLGITYQDVKNSQQEGQYQKEEHHCDLRIMLEKGDPKNVTFVIINFSIYGQLINKVYVPAEVALTAFNVKEGITDNFCTLIDPYAVPIGLGIEARKNSERLGVPYPPFDNRLQNYAELAQILEKFIDRHMHPKVHTRGVYCLSTEVQVNQGCLDWLYSQIPDKQNQIQLWSLGEAIHMLSNIGVCNRANQESRSPMDIIGNLMYERGRRDSTDWNTSQGYFIGSTSESTGVSSTSITTGLVTIDDSVQIRNRAGVFFHEMQVEDYLSSFNFAFDGEIGCAYHFKKDKGLRYCALNVTNRYAYNLLDAMITTYSVIPRLCYHQPGIRENSEMEMERRKEMLKMWGDLILSDKDFDYDDRKRDSRLVTVYPELGPNRPE